MPGTRTTGMDQSYYQWSPMPSRQQLRWPADARDSLCIIVNVVHFDMYTVSGDFTTGSMSVWRGS